jgi:hypothetical protein
MYEIILNKNDVPIYGSNKVHSPPTNELRYGKYVILDYQNGAFGTPNNELIQHTINGLESLAKFNCTNILLSYHSEAIHSDYWLSIINKVKEYGYKSVLVYDGGFNLDIKVPGIKIYHVMSDCLISFYTEPTIVFPRTKLYSCLSRKLRKNRLLMVSELFTRKLNYAGNITCGWTDEDAHLYDNPDIIENIPDNLKLLLPISIGSSDNHQGMIALEPEMYRTVFNLVLETNVAPELFLKNPLIESSSDRRYLTEKTIKAFVLGQIPIFLAVPGYVDELRKLGFDVFDDIVSHDYDNIKDVQSRIHSICNQISKLNRVTVTAWNSYLVKHMPRLIKNSNLVETLVKQCKMDLIKKVDNIS